MILLAGYISVEAAAEAVIVLNTNIIAFMFPLGLAVGTAAFIGRALGAGNVKLAKSYAVVTSVMGLIQSFFCYFC